MKPFDLEKALAGAPVVTRDGREVTQLHLFDLKEHGYPLHGVINGKEGGQSVECFIENGKWRRSGESEFDLFMKTEKKVGYVLPDNISDTCVSDKWVRVEYEE